MIAATNDVDLITLPDGRRFAVTIFGKSGLKMA